MESVNSTKNQIILNVSQINQHISQTLEKNFSSIWVKGEVSNFINHGSGHWYFSLKEETAQIKAVMFRGYNQKLSFVPKNGMEILVHGQINVYPPRGTYQLLCKEIEALGSGALQQNFEELKKKLNNEGLFDSSRKKPLPAHPKHIAIISSPTGAAIRDILQILKRRSAGLKITLVPALVQGDEAAASLLLALSQSQKIPNIDACIIGRGGGSKEDLAAFNDETLARAIANYPLPIISAVGHEIDFTISDFVADLRAPTPSAAAELIVKSSRELLEKVLKIEKQLIQSVVFQIKFFREKISGLKNQLINPERLLQEKVQRVDEITTSLSRAINYILEKKKSKLANLNQLLDSLNPKQVMQRGFCIVSGSDGVVVNSSQQIKLKENISLEFFKGTAKATITTKE